MTREIYSRHSRYIFLLLLSIINKQQDDGELWACGSWIGFHMCHSLIFKGCLSSFLHPFSRIYPFYSATVSMETQQLQLFNLNFID